MIMNSNYSLEETIPDTQLRHIIFFNGRLLTGDLEPGQSAQHAHSRYLGMAVRPGLLGGSYLSESLIDAGPPPSGQGRIIMGRDRLNRKPTITP